MKFTDTLKSLEADGWPMFLSTEFLRNHAKEIINLVEAAENVERYLDASYRRMPALSEALAALNKEQSKEIDPNKWAFDRKLESY